MDPDLEKIIETADLEWISFGPDDSYVFKTADGAIRWNNVNQRIENLVYGRAQQHVTLDFANLGYNNAYFLLFSDGKFYYDGVSDKLARLL